MTLKFVAALPLLFSAFAAEASDSTPIVDAETEFVVSSPTPAAFMPTEAEIDTAIQVFDGFENLLDQGKWREAYSMLTESNQKVTQWSEWESQQKSKRTEYGGDAARQLFRIIWYPNPPSADQSGLYIALDFASKTRSGGFRCGYIVLLKQTDGSLKVTRTDDTWIASNLVDGTLPKPDLVTQLPCYLGKTIKTAFGVPEQ